MGMWSGKFHPVSNVHWSRHPTTNWYLSYKNDVKITALLFVSIFLIRRVILIWNRKTRMADLSFIKGINSTIIEIWEWINEYIHIKLYDVTTYPSPNLNGNLDQLSCN